MQDGGAADKEPESSDEGRPSDDGPDTKAAKRKRGKRSADKDKAEPEPTAPGAEEPVIKKAKPSAMDALAAYKAAQNASSKPRKKGKGAA